MEPLIPSIAVSMPTRAMIPMDIINAVIVARVLLPLMECKAILITSINFTDFFYYGSKIGII
jgi:hypothetical protein